MFEDKINFSFKINQYVLKQISFIDSFKGKWDIIEHKENTYLKELKKIATIESIGSSTRIEGSTLTDDEIKSLLKNIKITKFTSRDQQEVIGYYEALELIFENYKELSITENYIKQLHKILLEQSEKDNRHRGNYKNLNNTVIATYPGGGQKVIFRTTEPFLVEKEMSDLLAWTNGNIDHAEIHSLIVIALFIYEFLSIHPFQDGNGRLSRLLTTVLLLKKGYHFVKYISFEHIIEERKKEYYRVLMECQKNRYKPSENVALWVCFFLDSLEALIQKLQVKYNIYASKGGYLNERQKQILEFIKLKKVIKFCDVEKKFKEISGNTIKKDLQYLKHENFINQIGQKKGTIYQVST